MINKHKVSLSLAKKDKTEVHGSSRPYHTMIVFEKMNNINIEGKHEGKKRG